MSEARRLMVGGVHAFEEACTVEHVEPVQALEDLGWKGQLVIRVRGEGRAELVCGGERTALRFERAARFELRLVDPADTVAGNRFPVRAVPRRADGEALEIGKWTELQWKAEGELVVDEDRSAVQLGIIPTAFGMQRFRASAEGGDGAIEARLGDVSGRLEVTARP